MAKEDNQTAKPESPKLVRRRENRRSTFKLGRTIGAKRERLETANERAIARKKNKQKKYLRVVLTAVGFAVLIIILAILFQSLTKDNDSVLSEKDENYEPTVEIIDEAIAAENEITTKMKNYIGRAEKDFRDLGYNPIKVVIPVDTIREVDFYLENHPGFIKLIIDRDSAISVEDADRMLRYLSEKGISDFTYIDVRIDGKAYWK